MITSVFERNQTLKPMTHGPSGHTGNRSINPGSNLEPGLARVAVLNRFFHDHTYLKLVLQRSVSAVTETPVETCEPVLVFSAGRLISVPGTGQFLSVLESVVSIPQ